MGEKRQVSVLSKEEMNRPVREFVIPVEILLYSDQSIQEAIEVLQQGKIDQKNFYFYVVDRKHQLKGVVSTSALVVNPLALQVGEVMDKVFAFLHTEQNLKEAMLAMERHRLLAIPVIDDQFRFLGVVDAEIYFDDTIKKVEGLLRRDIFQYIGLKIEEGKIGTPWRGYRIRMPLLICNLISGIVCAIVAYFYQALLAKMLILAMFIPLVLTLCESVSIQAMTQSLSILHAPKLLWGVIRKRIWLEVRTVTLLSATCAVVVGAISWFWGQGWDPADMIGSALLIAIVVSSLVGMVVPLVLRMIKMDPKLASGPLILMIVDPAATVIYFAMASLWL